jgi:hypothetical protein
MANVGKAMGGGGSPTDSPTSKISIRDYDDMSIIVKIEIKKAESSGV